MRHEIFIRTYKGDIEWLQYCLRSLKKFGSGFDRIRIVAPIYQLETFKAAGFSDVETCPVYHDDYLGQQITKLYADTYTGTDCTVTYVDSDCFFTRPFHVDDLLDSIGRPVFLMTPYSKIGNDVPWRPITESALKCEVEFEFMRRLPITVRAVDIKDFRDWFRQVHGKSVETYVSQQPHRSFSEFNVLGAWLYSTRTNEYAWLHTEQEQLPEVVLRQGWSWGGLTPEGKQDMEALLAA